ncbi:MAG: GNAT family N-acetyltransferase [Phenylobacterium sp.]|uniref:bifunctional acetate--CoA ligase family protein/GNAT family N-acetyltransferase n=1 Tax=Phenylobacterium sp. TaxID=1871053 RepID=UPI00120B6234|nr:bifunctional acetate--CoA ligase family protein/GNAT family N-acetyltransferase [Phenylobacterium sp.]TAJ73607.1 MAG: GNAT family N-acetyltransferase [Phenylobacterium sp.]
MTTRNFEALFAPKRIALIGASDRPGSVGEVLAANLLAGGFSGELLFVNPKGRPVHGRTVFPSIAALPAVPDLAVIATPAPAVAGAIAELGGRGCRAAVVISAGFEGDDPESAARRQALLDAAKPHLLRVIGPNCLGLLSPRHGVNASFARNTPPAGAIALVAQSGAVAAAALDWAPAHGLGFSHVVTLGDSLDVDVGDMLDFLGRDPATRAILLYVESLRDARKFMSAARYAARAKPVILLKGGRSRAGAKAAFSHTRALAGADDVYAAAFRRAGVLQVDGLDDFLDAALVFAHGRPKTPGSLAILTNGGGAGVLAVDALERVGGQLTVLSAATQETLRALSPAHSTCANPVDILGDAPPDLYARSLAALLAAPEVDAVLVINCPTAVADSGLAADAVIAARAADAAHKPVLAAWLGEPSVAAGRARLAAAGVATYPTAEAAVRAFSRLAEAQRLHDQLLEAPDGAEETLDAGRAREIVRRALAEGRAALDPIEVQGVLRAYGVSTPDLRLAATPEAAGEAAMAVAPHGPVALKIQSPDISHKSDVGGVQLGLTGGIATARAAEAMLSRLKVARPDARLDGFLVQPMVSRPRAQEVLAGLVRDPTFGPVIVVGHGGVSVEVVADRALGLPPLNVALARDMIARTRVARLLAGYRDRPPADLDALAAVLVALGRLAVDLPEVAELDLNPVLCDDEGALAIDARIAVRAPDLATARPAILPYPAHLTRTVEVAGEPLTLRPIRPSDAARLVQMVDACTPEDVRLRFSGGMLHLDRDLATRLSQIDYDRHMALVAETAAGDLVGVGRLVEDPEGETAEFALMVRSDRQHHGLGGLLLQAVLDYASGRGLREVWGQVARENRPMLDLSHALGFTAQADDADMSRVCVTRPVGPAAS